MVNTSSSSAQVADARQRFAEAVSSARQQQQERSVSRAGLQGEGADRTLERQQVQHEAEPSLDASSSSSPSPRLNQPSQVLSGATATKLLGLIRTVSSRSSSSLTPLQLFEKVVAMDELIHHARGGMVPANEVSLGDAFDELNNARMDSLTPELQQLKLGWEQIPLTPGSFRDVERRINQLLRANGETEPLHFIFGGYRIDTSTDPPTRVRKTEQERDDDAETVRERLDDLKRRLPDVHNAVTKIMSELVPPGIE